MTEEENTAIVLLTELRGLYEAKAHDYEYRGTLSILVDEDDSDAIDTILNLVDKQQKEIKELNSEFALNTEIHKRDEEIKELKDTIKCLHEPAENYISKDKVLKALGYEENDEEYDRLKQDDEKILSILDTLYSEVCRLEDIEDQKVEVEVAFIEEKRDKYWQEKIKDILKKYEKRPLEEGICFYKEIENLLEEQL